MVDSFVAFFQFVILGFEAINSEDLKISSKKTYRHIQCITINISKHDSNLLVCEQSL